MIQKGIHFVTPPAALAEVPPKGESPINPANSPGTSPTANPTPVTGSTGSSSNWSGYFNWNGHGGYTNATGYFVEPSNHGSCSNASAYTWAGIGGWYNQNLGQDGTAQQVPGLGNNQAWTEVLPALPIATSLYSTPGSWFLASTEYTGSGHYSFYMYNYANGKATHATATGGFDGNVAEYVVERPGSYNLFNFNSVAFQGYTNGKAFQLDPAERINMYNETGELNASPSGISNHDAFNDNYSHCTGSGEGGSAGEGEGAAPAASTSAASAVTASAATLNGSVTPNGADTKYHFEYGTEAENYSSSTPEVDVGSGTNPVPSSSSITGLQAGTTYHYRLIANSPNGTTAGVDTGFTTTGTPPPPPPSVTTGGASAIGVHKATLEATVNPNGGDTHYYFEYGTNNNGLYELTAPVPPGSDEGSGITPTAVSTAVIKLASYTTYYYRIVASNATGTTYGTAQELKTNSAWRVQSTPSEFGEGAIERVSCTSVSVCTAVGYTEEGALAEHWNGKTWTAEDARSQPGALESHLTHISCSSASTCTAIGYYTLEGTKLVPLVEHWESGAWKIESIPIPVKAEISRLDDVSCSSTTVCTAVGFYEEASGSRSALVERWEAGKWSIQSSPVPSGGTEVPMELLWGVSCTSATACTAVGSYQAEVISKPTKSYGATLAEQWNGKAWTVVASPNPGGISKADNSSLSSVACSSSTECTAVGGYGEGEPSAARWNGTAWTEEAMARPIGASETSLQGLSCSGSSCATVGFYEPSGSKTWLGVTEYRNGAGWELEPPFLPTGTSFMDLTGVSCSSAAVCVSVGDYVSPGSSHSVAEESNFATE